MRFTKMHGAGNDYVYVDVGEESLPDDLPDLARRISDRHAGIGSDGLILIGPSPVADARMRMYNADGSEGEMCGNGLRCVAKYLHDHWRIRTNPVRVETARGVIEARLRIEQGEVRGATVNMGVPRLAPPEIPTTLGGGSGESPLVDHPLTVAGRTVSVTTVSMGNPHAVAFAPSLNDDLVRTLGPAIERHPAFPRRTNVEFVQLISRTEVRARVWERGAGETQACGTGACAVVVAGTLSGRTERKIAVHLPGGSLEVEWTASGDVLLTGPAVEVFTGDFPIEPRRPS